MRIYVSHERVCRVACQKSAVKVGCLKLAAPSGGARRDRTDDLLLAKQALSQLSYGPAPVSGGWLASRSSRQLALPAFAKATADNLRGAKAGVPTGVALAAKVGGPGKI